MPQPRQNPALRHLDTDLDLGFVAGLGGPGRNDDRVVVLRPVAVGALDARFVAARDRDARAQLVRHAHGWDAAEGLDGLRVARDPVRALLRARGRGEGVVRGAEHGDKQLDGDHLDRRGLDDRRALAGVIDKRILARGGPRTSASIRMNGRGASSTRNASAAMTRPESESMIRHDPYTQSTSGLASSALTQFAR